MHFIQLSNYEMARQSLKDANDSVKNCMPWKRDEAESLMMLILDTYSLQLRSWVPVIVFDSEKCILVLVLSAFICINNENGALYVFLSLLRHSFVQDVWTVYNIFKFSLAVRPNGYKQRKLNAIFIHFFCLCPLGLSIKLSWIFYL